MRRSLLGAVMSAALGVFALLTCPLFAQHGSQNPLVGTWEQTARLVNGKDSPLPLRSDGKSRGVLRVIYAADGHYILLRLAPGRPSVAEIPDGERTKEDWMTTFEGIVATYGTYVVSGDKLTTKIIEEVRPQGEGNERTVTFRLDADTLTTTNANGVQLRYRRVK